MTVAKKDDVHRVISPEREAKLERAFKKAWADVAADIGKYSRWPRTRANMVFERLAVRLQEEFADDTGATFYFHDETVKAVFDNLVLARCKKANDLGLGQNVPTQANFSFCEAQDELPGLEGLQKIEIVYGLNALQTDIECIVVQARDGNKRQWGYPIPSTADGSGTGTVTPLFPPAPPPPPSVPPDSSDLVQPRKTPVHKPETDKK